MLYWLVKLICQFFFSTGLVPVKVYGREHLKGVRNYLIAAKHQDGADTVVLIWCLPFRLWFMLRDDLKEPMRTIITRSVLIVQISRKNPQLTQLRIAVDRLRSGKPLVVFPEGTRSEKALRAKRGVSTLARKSGVPVVPISINGTYGLLRKWAWVKDVPKAILRLREPIRVVIHEPLYFNSSEGETRQSFADKVMMAIASGMPTNLQGYYANPTS